MMQPPFVRLNHYANLLIVRSEESVLADEINLALIGSRHSVFFDKTGCLRVAITTSGSGRPCIRATRWFF
jgi:hypothetical protein